MSPTHHGTIAHIRDALAWRLNRLLGDRLVYGSVLAFARRWRNQLTRPSFIAVTGSAGKTTTKELLLGMLANTGRDDHTSADYPRSHRPREEKAS